MAPRQTAKNAVEPKETVRRIGRLGDCTMKVMGEGSVVALEDKPRNRCRQWQIRIRVERDGRKSTRTRNFSGTYSDAKKERERFREELASEGELPKGATFDEVASAWYEERVRSGRYAQRTLRTDDHMLKNPRMHLGAVPVAEITGRNLEAMFAQLRAGVTASGRKIGNSYLVNIYTYTVMVLDWAEEKGLCGHVRMRKALVPKLDAPRTRSLDPDEVFAFVRNLPMTIPQEAALILSVACGLRRSEALALRWSDIGSTEVSVTRSVDDDGTFKEPMTRRGTRIVPLPPAAAIKLAKWRKTQEEFAPCCDLVCSADGHVMMPPAFSIWWQRHRRDYGVTCTLHELRHTYATALARGNVSPFVMQAILGHENISTTMRYVHISESDKQAAVSSVLPASFNEVDLSEHTA